MDTKNVVAAISLSAAVIVLYSLFFAPETVQRAENLSENDNIQGSISLKGAIIDDLTFKNYNTELESNENVVLLNPRNI